MLKDEKIEGLQPNSVQNEDKSKKQKILQENSQKTCAKFTAIEWLQRRNCASNIHSKISKKFLWHSLRATIFGSILIFVGVLLAVMGKLRSQKLLRTNNTILKTICKPKKKRKSYLSTFMVYNF